MPGKTTTVRVYPADAQRLDEVRKALQKVTGDDMTIADAVSACLQSWDSAAAKREIARINAKYEQHAAAGKEA